jgi:hypothetical protein
MIIISTRLSFEKMTFYTAAAFERWNEQQKKKFPQSDEYPGACPCAPAESCNLDSHSVKNSQITKYPYIK